MVVRYVVQRSACSLYASFLITLLGGCRMTCRVYSYGWGLIASTAGEPFMLVLSIANRWVAIMGFSIVCPSVMMRVDV